MKMKPATPFLWLLCRVSRCWRTAVAHRGCADG